MSGRHVLPDGSVAVVEPRDWGGILLSREVNGECVWGQAFSLDAYDSSGRPDEDAPRRRLLGLLASMEHHPEGYDSRHLRGFS